MDNNLKILREMIFESDDKACFIERERTLNRLSDELSDFASPKKEAIALSRLLSEVSTPIHECDIFGGRVVEELPDPDMNAPSCFLRSLGHMSFDYKRLLELGLRGILEDIERSAKRKATAEAYEFLENASMIVEAIRSYSLRYSAAAEKCGKKEIARALACVPYEPAYDFYSALQSIWLIHMIASCYVGSRDYAFGKFDEYMLPYYEQAIKSGKDREEICKTLAGFFIKTNEICGRRAHNYMCKPTLSHSSKQYVNIGGKNPNAFSSVVLDAACINNMPQPQITVILDKNANQEFTNNVFKSLSVLVDKIQIYNFPLIKSKLTRIGIDECTANDFTFSACSTLDLGYHTTRRELFVRAPEIFIDVLNQKEYSSLEEIIDSFTQALVPDMQRFVDREQRGRGSDRRMFVLDALLLTDTAKECEYPCDSTSAYNFLNIFCPGIATIGDSLMVIDRLVFKERRYSYHEFMEIIRANWEGNEEIRSEILSFTKFGNDSDSDEYTVRAAKAFIAATEVLSTADNFWVIPGFYSLDTDTAWMPTVRATPDGRLNFERFSENQSPTYGADKNGTTSLLKSIAKLPLTETATGALNISFSSAQTPEVLAALTLSYFELGGLHVGISVFDKEQLKDAMVHPERHRSLTVRMYGFSEYFISLSPKQQDAVISRTVN